jgi:murein DD-endopeptidase MepM/ murein hydrolase activator NlpD
MGYGKCRRDSQTCDGIGGARAGRHSGTWRRNRGTVAASHPQPTDCLPGRRRFATGNASKGVGFAGGPQTAAYGGERFGIEGPDRRWAQKMREGGGGVAAAPGQPAGQPGGGGGELFDPITSRNFMGGVGATSASRGRGGHQGEDWGAPVGSPVHAVKAGTIVRHGVDNFGQPTVTIRHDDGTFTRDMHLQPGSMLPVGSRVAGGQQYARSGSANRVAHLHHERWSGQPGARGSSIISPRQEAGWGRDQQLVGGQRSPRGSIPSAAAEPGESRAAGGEGGGAPAGMKETEGVPHLDHYRQLREDLERPIKMNIEAPDVPNQLAPQFRRSSARNETNREIREARWSSYSDIGAA